MASWAQPVGSDEEEGSGAVWSRENKSRAVRSDRVMRVSFGRLSANRVITAYE
jgi:hypothetical protein